MFIQTEPTPNPQTLKFLPGSTVMEQGAMDLADASDAEARSPLARRVFAVDGVKGVYLGRDFISVTKESVDDWYVLKPAVLGAIMEHFMSGEPHVMAGLIEQEAYSQDGADDETVRQIKELLNTRVRPAVAQDGGDIVFHGFERGIVYLHMRGACAGCPSSAVTLKNGVENLLKYYVPDVIEVRSVS